MSHWHRGSPKGNPPGGHPEGHSPKGSRTPVSGSRIPRPRPLDDGAPVGEGGFEPPRTAPEAAVLPLDDSPANAEHNVAWCVFGVKPEPPTRSNPLPSLSCRARARETRSDPKRAGAALGRTRFLTTPVRLATMPVASLRSPSPERLGGSTAEQRSCKPQVMGSTPIPGLTTEYWRGARVVNGSRL